MKKNVARWALFVLALLVALPSAAQLSSDRTEAVGFMTLTLGSAVDSTGAQTAVAVPGVAYSRLQVVFSASDGANDVDIEGSVDGGTTYHLLKDIYGADATATADGIIDILGPLTHIRANVIGLGGSVTVSIDGRSVNR